MANAILDSMKNFIKYVTNVTRAVAGKLKSVQISGNGYFTGYDSFLDSRSMQTYKTSLYVYIGVSMIARRVAGIPLNFYTIKGTDGEVVEVLDHAVIDLIANPTPYLTQKEFSELVAMFYLLSGDVFLYIEKVPNSKKAFMHPLRPADVEIILNATNTAVVAYRYQTGGVTAVLQPENVVHIKNIDPTNFIRGEGMLAPASTRIVTEQEATKYQSTFFKNQGRPDVAVFIDQDLTQAQIDEGRAKWQEVYGRGQGGQAGFFGKNVKEVKMLAVTPREMDFIATQKFLRDDILASLHIPKAMVTSDDVNLANAKEAYKMYMQEAVLPVMDAIKDAYNNRLLPMFDDSLFTRYDNPVPEDRDIKLKEAVQLKKAGIISANEARDLYGYGALDGADELSTGSDMPNLQLLAYDAKQVLKARPVLRKRLIAIEKTAKAMVALQRATATVKQPVGAPLFKSVEQKKAYAEAVNKMVDAKADKLEPTVNKYFDGMLKRILDNSTQAFSTTGFMDTVDEVQRFKSEVVPAFKAVLEQAGQEVLDAIYTPKKSVTGEQFVLTPALLAKYAERTSMLADSIVNTAHETVKGVIMAGLANGDGVDVIGEALRTVFTEMQEYKGKQIARTETGYAQSLATQEAYEQSSVVAGKEWITAGDEKVRDEHLDNEAQGVIPKNATFSNGEMYPAQHTINCRCVIAPALGEVGL